MSDESPPSQDSGNANADREERFDEVCADFLDAHASGETFNQEQALTDNPDLADSLRNFFRDHERMAGALHVDESTPQEVDQTIAYRSDDTASFDVGSNPGATNRIADYELIEKIAQGGMGVVYKARQLSLNRIVALKMIRSGELADAEEIRRFRVEAKAAAQLRHPGIVPIYQIGVDNGQDFFSMAYIEGESLADRVRRDALLPKEAANYVMKVSRAVQYAHDQGIIHRDIKPANVLLDRNDNPLVMDFGLAKQIQSDHQLTMSGQILGTASYMSPEQARGDQSQIGPSSDVYSLGALLYTLLTQQPPFTGDNPIEIILDVLSKDPDAPSASNMRLSRDIETICLKCLEKKPAKRYASAAELSDDLQRFLDGVPISARPITKFERVIRWCQRKPAITTSIVLGMALLVGLPIASRIRERIVSEKEQDKYEVGAAQMANTQYVNSGLLDPERYEGQERLYILAAKTMLVQLQHASNAISVATDGLRAQDENPTMLEAVRTAFEEMTLELEEALTQSPSDEVRFALADCLANLSRDQSIAKQQRRDLLDRALDCLTEIQANSDSPSELLLARIALIRLLKLQLSPKFGAEELRKIAQQSTVRKLDSAYGVIRFDFDEFPLSSPIEQIATPHEALLKDLSSGLREYSILFSTSKGELSLDAAETRQLFCDMAILSDRISKDDGLRSGGALPLQAWPWIWPQDSKGIYDAILGMALSQTQYAARDFQVR